MAYPFPSQDLSNGEICSILIVDDEIELTAALSDMLINQGFRVQSVNRGSDALESIRTQNYDLMLIDLMMPDMDGISLMKQATMMDTDLVCLIMTGQGTVKTAVEAMQNGAFDYILKPFKMNALLNVINRSLEIRRLRLENVQLREIVNIHELGNTLAHTLDMDLIIHKTAEAALHQVQADEVSILIPTHEQNEFTIAYASGSRNRSMLVGKSVPYEGTIAGWVARNRQPLNILGKVEDGRFQQSVPRPEVHSSVSMPMISGNKLIGVINVGMTHQRRELTQGQIRALSILVGIAASAMENARLYEQTEKRLQRLSALRTIDLAITSTLELQITLNILLDQVANQLAADAVVIALYDEKDQTLEFTACRGLQIDRPKRSQTVMGMGLAGLAVMERRTVAARVGPFGDGFPAFDPWMNEEGFQSCYSTPLIAMGEVEGVLQVLHRTPVQADTEWLSFFEALAGQAAIAINNARLFETIQISNQQLTLAYNATIEGWSRALDLRDRETEGHTQRVTEMTLKLAHALDAFSQDDLVQIKRGSLLHDIGKMGVPDQILLKAGPLTDEEWVIMRRHPEYAYQLLYPISYLRDALDIPYYHHERWDGSGYPHGLQGEQIPLSARAFAIADVWDALRSDRPYRPGLPEEDVLEYIQQQSGTHFDPKIVDVFLRIIQTEEKSPQL